MDDKIKDYCKDLESLILKSNDSFEKQLNYISAGSLGLSMILVEKVVKDLSLTIHNWILITSWTFLGLTLISNLLSHVYASKVHSRTVNEIKDEQYNYINAAERYKHINIWNLVSIGMLLLGLIFQIIFITINIKT